MAYTTIDDPEAHFQVQLYTGDGAANHAITLGGNTDMQPDLVWIKNRDATDSHCVFDSVRGATKLLHMDNTDAETTDTDTLDSFTSDGFQVDADVKVNTSSEDYIAWCWKAGTTSGISGGSLTPSSYSINTTSGFGVYAYTGTGANANIAHGLGIVPGLVTHRELDATGYWVTYNKGAGNTVAMFMNTTQAVVDDASYFNDTTPTSSLFYVGSNGHLNEDSKSYIAYAFAPVQGFSKFGSYTGNVNVDGQFIYTGFRPAFLMIKRSDSTDNWEMYDSKRLGWNGLYQNLYSQANETDAELSNHLVDLLSNGFKLRLTAAALNNGDYIYAAFAEAPFVNSEGVPCNAR